MNNLFRKLLSAATVGSLGLVGLTANANTITIADVSNVGGVFTYSASASNSQLKDDGNVYFVVYDFQGYVAGSATTSANWAFVGAQNAGPVPISTAAPDNASLTNLVWRYVGPTAGLNNDGAVGIGPLLTAGQGNFSATSTFTGVTLGWYASQDYDFNGGVATDAPQSGAVGRVNVPVPTTVPDGGMTVMLLGASLCGLSVLRKKLVRK